MVATSVETAGRGRRIAVFRALQLGDLLCAVPALRALRQGEGGAEIALVGLPWARTFVERYRPLVDRFVAFPGAPGFPEQAAPAGRLAAFLAQMREERFDLALQMHGSGQRSNRIVRAFGAAAWAGFGTHAGSAAPGPRLLPWPGGHEIERLLALTSSLGYRPCGAGLEFPLQAADFTGWDQLARTHGLAAGAYVCIHPGARLPSRRWPVDRFAAVARSLRKPWRIVVTGAAEEADLARTLCAAVGAGTVNLCGQTSLGSLAVLLRRARLLVCNDTGVSHLSAAVGGRSVVVSCGSESARWAPLDHGRHIVLADQPPCRPCGFHDCPYGHICALRIEPAAVVGAAMALLRQGDEG
ncbi:glycosyltransferase family 9 protein [Cupriavidus malaysiensis]|uniref:LPS biosynthesis glycosyltransferase n=1 Tax=Cupriavidus malaysiensis TaxID=367825 RepID=A0ABM6FFC5_9BURK|nr:glycosyltransferase family 9 protein [Cupriavidus malaysiensis]AOZ10598.1 LPS biosynthesis glycosyltransferase [Cupriavidus malaysiensis]